MEPGRDLTHIVCVVNFMLQLSLNVIVNVAESSLKLDMLLFKWQ
jgi:hypothetical protein